MQKFRETNKEYYGMVCLFFFFDDQLQQVS